MVIRYIKEHDSIKRAEIMELCHLNKDQAYRLIKLLIKKQDISDEELSELGDIEHGLIEINSKMSAIKKRLDDDLFGETMNQYYLLKSKAKKGDVNAKKKLDQLRSSISDSVVGDTFFNWN